MRGNLGTVPLADGQEPVLPIVLGNTHTPVNTTQHILGPVWVDSAIPVEAENAWHLPAAAEPTAMRKCGRIEVSCMLRKAQGIGAVRSGTDPPFRSDTKDAH